MASVGAEEGESGRIGEDAPRVEASSATLHAVDALRAASVLEEARERLNFISILEPDVLSQRAELSAAVGDEVARVLREQRRLEERYEDLLSQRAALRGTINARAKAEPLTAELESVARRLRELTKALSRSLESSPQVNENLRKVVQERQALSALLLATVSELRSPARTYVDLKQFVAAEKHERAYLESLRREERRVVAEVEELQEHILRERREHAEEVRKLEADAEHLKAEIRRLREATSTVARASRREAAAETEALARKFRLEEEGLEEEVEAAKRELAIETGAHSTVAEELTAQMEGLVAESKAVPARLEALLHDAEDSVRKLQAERDRNREELQRLVARFQAEAAREAEEKAAEEEAEARKKRRIAQEKREHAAASEIQRHGIQMFRMIQEKGLLKKKKKGKKKKK